MAYPDKNDLPKGAQTHLKNWAKSKFFKRSKQVFTKYMDKGSRVEDQAIEMLSEYWDFSFLFKNEKQLEDDHMTGCPDIITKTKVVEMKSPWDWSTFPAFEDKIPESDYFWQCQGYMALTGLDFAQLVYVLCDTPEDYIAKEARFRAYQFGMAGEYDEDFYYEVEQELTYNDVCLSDRIKIFDIKRDEMAIEQIRRRVELSRKFLSQLNF